MARSHLTLAALATSAVPELDIVAASAFGSGAHGDFESALLTGRDGRHWIIRIPNSERAEAEQSADLLALRALSAGIRSRLPFTVSAYAGQAPVSGTRAVVYEFVYGSKLHLASIPPGEGVATSIGEAIAAIHSLPTSFIADAGLPVSNPVEILRSTVTVLDRSSATGLVPAALLDRWEKATEESELWQFQPAVINGNLSAESFLSADGAVTGVLGWHGMSVGDPARDLFWILGSRREFVAETVFDAYTGARAAADRQLAQRAMLYAELEIAKWLLHGMTMRSTEIVDDAVEMLHGLLDTVENDLTQTLGPQTLPAMDVDDVQAMLQRNG